jgi:hypothetical protein
MPGGPNLTSTWIYVGIAALVVVRFLFRELRQRTVRVRTLWIRPGILAALTLLLVVGSLATRGSSVGALATALVVGGALGVITGMLVARSTTFAPAGERGAVLARGSAITVAIWLVALALRFAARFLFAGSGASPAEQFELNAGLVALITAAFIVVALEFHRAIDRLAPSGTQSQTQTQSRS